MTVYEYDVIVIGTGAAGYNAACRIKEMGKKSVAIVTEGINTGTSRNTGSDKQTYYKLGLGGSSPDSVYRMAENLFAGGSVDGDNALCEAALSARCFMYLVEAGVEFPVNRYGEYVGYKTDHDPYARATSAGPLTSKFMTEALEKKAKKLEIEVYDKLLAVEILKKDEKVCGVLCLERTTGELIAISCGNIVMATGGPAGIYADSVYPLCHTGSTALALSAGASAQNLTEWQYGIASVNPRWNVSGTYMQVLPRFVSIDSEGREYEFLSEYFEDEYSAMSMVFLKGYQWPFDSRKILSGSSVIDLLVYRESVLRNRRVYLDFTKNPFNVTEIDYKKLDKEAYEYLMRAEGLFGTPVERLEKMNLPAIEHYRDKGTDITKEYLEIALCAQHNNGGIAVDMWWQTSVEGLFAAGECAGTHGVARPGGSALNAGQVGSLRAAMYISEKGNNRISKEEFIKIAGECEKRHIAIANNVIGSENKVEELILNAQRRMSDMGGAIRDKKKLKQALSDAETDLHKLGNEKIVMDKSYLFLYYKLKDILITQKAVLSAMLDFSEKIGATRGSALYYDSNGEKCEKLEESFRFTSDSGESNSKIQEIKLSDEGFKTKWRPVRPIPENNDFFENIWKGYRQNKNVY